MKRMSKRLSKKKTSRPKGAKAAAKAGRKPTKAVRVAARLGSPHAERARATGPTPAIASGTKAAAARKQKEAAQKKKKSGAAGEAEAELRRLQSARRKLERQLTAAVQEIGLLRQYETRARFLEAEVQKRDAQLADLRRQYEARIHDLESRAGSAAPEAAQGRLI
ncbi:MAG: hypothetical protein ACREQY_03850 [Candidatus Binatia bacterium]